MTGLNEDPGVGVGVSDSSNSGSSTSGSAWNSRGPAVIGIKTSSALEKETRALAADLGSGTSSGVGDGVSFALGAARTGTGR